MTAQRVSQTAPSAGRYLSNMDVYGVQETPHPAVFTTNHAQVHLQTPVHLLRSEK